MSAGQPRPQRITRHALLLCGIGILIVLACASIAYVVHALITVEPQSISLPSDTNPPRAFADTNAPVLDLYGSREITLTAGETFTEPGYSATDDTDGDLTAQVALSGTIDATHIGDYTLTYSVRDAVGNTASASRVVHVVTAAKPNGTNTTIYLTLDDGPAPGVTDQFLDMLNEADVPVTFFVTGIVAGPASDALMVREIKEGHGIGLHTWSHQYADVYASIDAYFADLRKIHDHVQEATGQDTRLVRFPGGSSNSVSASYTPGIMSRLVNLLPERGYAYADWNVSSGDGGNNSDKDFLLANLKNGTIEGQANVVLSHDTKLTSLEPIREYILWCKDRGYAFKILDESSPLPHHQVNN